MKTAKELLRGCAAQFRLYEQSHRAKATDPSKTVDARNTSAGKADVNAGFASQIEKYLSTPDYHELAMRTAAGPEVFHYPGRDRPEYSTVQTEFLIDLATFIEAAAVLDLWKSRLFYGKTKERVDFPLSEFVGDNWSMHNIGNPQVIHAILGLATESSELVEDLIKLAGLDTNDTRDTAIVDNVVRETGDIDWFQELLASSIGVSVEKSREVNIERLAKRYPDKFTEAAAIARADELPLG